MQTVYKNKAQCCGCGLCSTFCPKKAITMQNDENGFIYPVIDESLCIDCHVCEKKCSYGQYLNADVGKSYAGMNLDSSQRIKSTSAGIFASVATYIINDGGLVCGATMNIENGQSVIKHTLISRLSELQALQGSKYVQSDITDTLDGIKIALENKQKVLFTGTPCQVSAIKKLVKNDQNLYTIDLICHGVPSNSMFNNFLELLNKKYKGHVADFKFRDKNKGWGLRGTATVNIDDGSEKKIDFLPDDLSYYRLFLDGEIYRESCYSCPYAQTKRVGDITIGDYWGAAQYSPELMQSNGGPFLNNEGVSCVLVNSEKGNQMIFETCSRGYMLLTPVQMEKILIINKQLKQPAQSTKIRKRVLKEYQEHGYAGVERIHQMLCIRKKLKQLVGRLLPKSLKRILKK